MDIEIEVGESPASPAVEVVSLFLPHVHHWRSHKASPCDEAPEVNEPLQFLEASLLKTFELRDSGPGARPASEGSESGLENNVLLPVRRKWKSRLRRRITEDSTAEQYDTKFELSPEALPALPLLVARTSTRFAARTPHS